MTDPALAPTPALWPHPEDVAPEDRARVAAAEGRYRVEVVTDPAAPAFAAAWGMLDAFFGPRGEMEAPETIARFVREGLLPYGDGLEGHYRLLAAWDGERLVGVRDCYVDLDLRAGVCVLALSHVLVAPSERRGGLAAVLRNAPVSLARQVARERLGREVGVLVAAEMEPADPAEPDTVVRLLAYGRAGFSVVDPRRLPYSQPDFRPAEQLDGHVAIPLLPVVRPVGEGLTTPDGGALPVDVAAAFPRLFHGCHRMFLPPERVDPSEVHALRALCRQDGPAPLLPLPRSVAGLHHLDPLVRGEVLPLYPRRLRGPSPEPGDPGRQRAGLDRWAAA